MHNGSFYSNNRIPIVLVFVSMFVFGAVSLVRLDYSLLPDIEYPELAVVTHYPNATPSEIRDLVSIPIEQAVLTLKGVKDMSSLSREGMSVYNAILNTF